MAIDVGKLSVWDTVRFQWFVSLPALLWGLATPNRWLVGRLVWCNTGKKTARFLASLRHKYRSSYLSLCFPWSRTLLVMDPAGMSAVLASKDNFADPDLKKRTLSQFVPDALVVSSGEEWQVRRAFNESALQFGKRLHRHADAFAQIIDAEVHRFGDEHASELGWADFQALAERIAHQVLLGQGHLDPEMTTRLAQVVRRSNWYLLPRAGAAFAEFYARLEDRLSQYRDPAQRATLPRQCLVADGAALVQDQRAATVVSAPTQIGFWFYVIKDALELNVARTLALIATHADVSEQIQREVDAMATASAQNIDGLDYTESCIREQLRLWTPVPMLLRRVVRGFELPGEVAVAAGQKILMHAGFYHRDAAYFGAAAHRFSPRPTTHDTSPHVYTFSDGHQSCAGQFVARFLLKATLALLLKRNRFELIGPRMDATEVPYLCDHFAIRLRMSPRT